MRHKHSLSFFLILLCLAGDVARAATIAGHIKIDHFGYRTTDTKIAYFTQNPGSSVGLYNASTASLVYTTTNITFKGTDTGSPLISGDSVWWVDFSPYTTAGTYYLYSSSLNEISYNFHISDTVYATPMLATLKQLYYQRCGTASKPATYAGTGWSDPGQDHPQDTTAPPQTSCTFPQNYGTLNLSGGYHDAGDYNKYIGYDTSGCSGFGGDRGTTLENLLDAYEWNPSNWTQTINLPESGNGIPDILNSVKWETDWYLKMQMTDYHVLSLLHQTNYSASDLAPPSHDTTTVYYYYPPNPSSEAEFVATLARAARVMSGIPALASYAQTLRTAAENTWTAQVQPTSTGTTGGTGSLTYRVWAAAEIFRMEEVLGGSSTIISQAQTIVDNFRNWSSGGVGEAFDFTNQAMYAYIQAPNATSSVVSGMKGLVGNLVNYVFSEDDLYHSGMYSGDYYQGSNQVKAIYAFDLIWGAQLGATGSYTAAQCLAHAEDFLHYLNGANPMNMTYISNADALGAKHGVWRFWHQWFGYYLNSSTFSYINFIGPPSSYVDPLYPYFSGTDNFGITDSGYSTYGPPPGFVPQGPTYQYPTDGGKAQPPLLAGGALPPYEKVYRDWDYCCTYPTHPELVNESGIYMTQAYTALSSVFVAPHPAPNPPTGLTAVAD